MPRRSASNNSMAFADVGADKRILFNHCRFSAMIQPQDYSINYGPSCQEGT